MFSRKQMIKLLAPLIVEQIMAVLVGMVDVVMVAAVGESAVSGVSLVDSISVLIIQSWELWLPEEPSYRPSTWARSSPGMPGRQPDS